MTSPSPPERQKSPDQSDSHPISPFSSLSRPEPSFSSPVSPGGDPSGPHRSDFMGIYGYFYGCGELAIMTYAIIILVKIPHPKTLLILDFICALSGGILYFLLFDFLQSTLGLPRWIVMIQLVANNVYGLCGVFIFMGGKQKLWLFKYLIHMNFIYATFCLVLAAFLFADDGPIGMWLVFAEGFFIFLLATIERRSLR